MTIELRLTDVDPPTAEPKRTIYRDIANLPDPTVLGVTIRYFNYDDVDLYMQITGSATGYTFTPANLGLLATGTNAYANLDNFASRAKPTVAQLPNGEMTENITLTLKGYTDSGYTDLKWTFERIVTVIWINSTDAAFTVDELDNFDDGTVQGWAVADELNNYTGYPTIAVATDYVLSTPYSCKFTQNNYAVYQDKELRGRLYKDFTTPNKTQVYAVFDLRLSISSGYGDSGWAKYFNITEDDVTKVHIGRDYDTEQTHYCPFDKWIRIVIPLTPNTLVTLKIIADCLAHHPAGYWVYLLTWLDDFKIISK